MRTDCWKDGAVKITERGPEDLKDLARMAGKGRHCPCVFLHLPHSWSSPCSDSGASPASPGRIVPRRGSSTLLSVLCLLINLSRLSCTVMILGVSNLGFTTLYLVNAHVTRLIMAAYTDKEQRKRMTCESDSMDDFVEVASEGLVPHLEWAVENGLGSILSASSSSNIFIFRPFFSSFWMIV